MINLIFTCALFAYGMFTIQRQNFFANGLTSVWKKHFPKQIHEALYSCGVCVSSVWGIFAFFYQYTISHFCDGIWYLIAISPFVSICCAGILAFIDRAVKSFEYNYRYNPITPNVNYSYLERFDARLNIYLNYIYDVPDGVKIIEIGGFSSKLKSKLGDRYFSFDKLVGNDITKQYIEGEYFVLIQGLAFEGNMDQLLMILSNSVGFIIEGSMSGESKRQLQQIIDNYPNIIRAPYFTSTVNKNEIPDHCGGSVDNRIVLIKSYIFR